MLLVLEKWELKYISFQREVFQNKQDLQEQDLGEHSAVWLAIALGILTAKVSDSDFCLQQTMCSFTDLSAFILLPAALAKRNEDRGEVEDGSGKCETQSREINSWAHQKSAL